VSRVGQAIFPGGTGVSGVLDISVADMDLSSSEDVKRNILRVCNKCSITGHIAGIESAALLYADTGKEVGGCSFLKGGKDSVNIGEWAGFMRSASSGSLIMVHNHTKMLPISFEDMDVALTYDSVGLSIVVIGKHAYVFEKQFKSPTNHGIMDAIIAKMKAAKLSDDYFKNSPEPFVALNNFLAEVLAYFDISLRRW